MAKVFKLNVSKQLRQFEFYCFMGLLQKKPPRKMKSQEVQWKQFKRVQYRSFDCRRWTLNQN